MKSYYVIFVIFGVIKSILSEVAYEDYENNWLVITATDKDSATVQCNDGIVLKTDNFEGLKDGLFICVREKYSKKNDATEYSKKLKVKGIDSYIKNAGNLQQNKVLDISMWNKILNSKLQTLVLDSITYKYENSIGIPYANKWLVVRSIHSAQVDNILTSKNYSLIKKDSSISLNDIFTFSGYFGKENAELTKNLNCGKTCFIKQTGFYYNTSFNLFPIDTKNVQFILKGGPEYTIACYCYRNKENCDDVLNECVKNITILTYSSVSKSLLDSVTIPLSILPIFTYYPIGNGAHLLKILNDPDKDPETPFLLYIGIGYTGQMHVSDIKSFEYANIFTKQFFDDQSGKYINFIFGDEKGNKIPLFMWDDSSFYTIQK
jgi:hypothetical protein